MKLMRADKRDAIVAAAIYSAVATFGVTYSIESRALQWERERFDGFGKVTNNFAQYLISEHSACIQRIYNNPAACAADSSCAWDLAHRIPAAGTHP